MAAVHFRSEGQGTPVLVVHGWTLDGTVEVSDFEPIFLLKPGYRRLYVDLPGHGSTPMDGARNLDDMFVRLAQFIEKEILPARFLVTGSSCGAYFAQKVAYHFRDHVLGLLLRVPHVGLRNADRNIDAFRPVILNKLAVEQMPSASLADLGSIAVQTTDYLTASLDQFKHVVGPAIAAADSEALGQIRDDDKRYVLAGPFHTPMDPCAKPTLIIAGRQDDVVGYRDGCNLLPSYTRATYIVMDRAGHGLPTDGMEMRLFRTLVEDWLERVKETETYHRP